MKIEKISSNEWSVSREGHDKHIVKWKSDLDVSEGMAWYDDEPMPGRSVCDCKGFAYRGKCTHCDAVIDAGIELD